MKEILVAALKHFAVTSFSRTSLTDHTFEYYACNTASEFGLLAAEKLEKNFGYPRDHAISRAHEITTELEKAVPSLGK